MNAPVDVLQHRAEATSKYGIIDCDVHPYPKAGALNKYLSERWRKHIAPGFVAAEWWRAGLGRRFYSATITRSLQHHLRGAGTASGRQFIAQSG